MFTNVFNFHICGTEDVYMTYITAQLNKKNNCLTLQFQQISFTFSPPLFINFSFSGEKQCNFLLHFSKMNCSLERLEFKV